VTPLNRAGKAAECVAVVVHGPAEIIVPGHSPFVVKIQKVEPLVDERQIRDIAIAIARIRDTVCTDGHGGYRIIQPHTFSVLVADCVDSGAPIQAQMALMASAMSALQIGQTVHGPAAVSGMVWHPEYQREYGAFLAHVEDPHPPPRQAWPVGTRTLPVTGAPGLRLRIQPSGHTLDNWDTRWFVYLCGQVIDMLWKRTLNEPVEQIEHVLRPQGDGVRFYPLATAAAAPLTNVVLVAVMNILSHVFARGGAREAEFTVLGAQGNHLGWGYFKLYIASGLLDSGRNSAVLSTSFGGVNETSNGRNTSVTTS